MFCIQAGMGRGSAAGRSEDVSFSDLETPKWSFKARQVNQDGRRTSGAGRRSKRSSLCEIAFVCWLRPRLRCSESARRLGPASRQPLGWGPALLPSGNLAKVLQSSDAASAAACFPLCQRGCIIKTAIISSVSNNTNEHSYKNWLHKVNRQP